MIVRRWHWSVLNVQSFRGADGDTDHYRMVAEVTDRLAGSKKAAQKFDLQKFNLRKLSELEVRKQYQIKISNRFAALENLNDSEDIRRAWENIIENNQTPAKERLGCYELKQHKPRFNKEFFIFRSKETG